MKKLLEILSNPHTRIPLETLLKCEIALESQLGSFKDHPVGIWDFYQGTDLMTIWVLSAN
jgi:hypothetical protein